MDGVLESDEGAITNMVWYFFIFGKKKNNFSEWELDLSGTQSLVYYIYHPMQGERNVTQAEGGFAHEGERVIYLGANHNDFDLTGSLNSFRGDVNHLYRYSGYIGLNRDQALKINMGKFVLFLTG